MKLFLRLGAVTTVVAAAGLQASCSSTDTTSPSVIYTDIYLDPGSFRGEVGCGEGPDTMRSYVVTMFDVTDVLQIPGQVDGDAGTSAGTAPTCGFDGDSLPGVALPSTPPLGCTLRAMLGGVVGGHSYLGRIDAYARPACGGRVTTGCVHPIGAGSSIMVDETGAVVPPLRRTRCGDLSVAGAGVLDGGALDDLNGPTLAFASSQVPLRGCLPLCATSPGANVVVRTSSLTDGIGCAPTGGIQRFSVSIDGATATDTACGGDATFPVTAGKDVSASVYAYAPDGAGPTWGTTCSAAAAAGTTATAVCDPLSKKGAIRVPVASTLAALGTTCSAGVTGIEATVVGTGTSPSVGSCADADVTLSGLLPAVYTVQVRARPSGAATKLCKAQVTPGHVTTIDCGGV